MTGIFDARPIVVALAGPNGAGKTTFFHAHLAPAGLRFVNADVVAKGLDVDPYAASALADAMRRELVRQRESFVFETVRSDPVGEKVTFLKETAAAGHAVVMCFIGVSSADVSEQRVAMRVMKGGHDVPSAKLRARHPRTMANLRRAIRALQKVIVYDNDDLARPFRRVAEFESGRAVWRAADAPKWVPRR